MSDQMAGHHSMGDSELEQKAKEYKELAYERAMLEERLQKVEEQKAKVSEAVYQKVRSEYGQKLDDIDRRLEPLAGEFEGVLRDLRDRRDTAAKELEEKSQALEEIQFRQSIGEFSPEEAEQLQEEHGGAVSDLESEIAGLDRKMGELTTMGLAPEESPATAVEDVQEEKANFAASPEAPPEPSEPEPSTEPPEAQAEDVSEEEEEEEEEAGEEEIVTQASVDDIFAEIGAAAAPEQEEEADEPDIPPEALAEAPSRPEKDEKEETEEPPEFEVLSENRTDTAAEEVTPPGFDGGEDEETEEEEPGPTGPSFSGIFSAGAESPAGPKTDDESESDEDTFVGATAATEETVEESPDAFEPPSFEESVETADKVSRSGFSGLWGSGGASETKAPAEETAEETYEEVSTASEETELAAAEAEAVAPPSMEQAQDVNATMVGTSPTEKPSKGFLAVIEGPDNGVRFDLIPVTMTLGREPSNTVHLNDNEVSRVHAKIIPRDNAFILQDLDSTNGTYVNDKRIVEVELRDNDHVVLGNSRIIVNLPR